jgi:hypothetical protein
MSENNTSTMRRVTRAQRRLSAMRVAAFNAGTADAPF